jgi:hypothetical protein
VLGEDAVDWVGLVARQSRESAAAAVRLCGIQDVLHDTEEAGVEGDAVGEGLPARSADDAPAGGGEGDLRFLIFDLRFAAG